MRRRGRFVLFFVTLLLVGVTSGGVSGSPVSEAVADDGTVARPDPETDVIGWEDGYWHNESIGVDQSDGLSDAELDRYLARAMARVEWLRDREFKRPVSVSIESRAAYRSRVLDRSRSDRYGAWLNQRWEALFIVGETTDAQTALASLYGNSVIGFYVPSSESIRIITATPDRPTLANSTLIHELTHALQDQYVGLASDQFRRSTLDGRLAAEGVIEGEASYIERRYVQRCGDEWSCVETPTGASGGRRDGRNLGMLLTLFQPYSDGSVYIADLRRRGGWSAVAGAYETPPSSTEQVIHRTTEPPESLTVTDTATDGWQRFDRYGDGGTDTLGEAAIYAMFWYQNRSFDAPIFAWRSARNVSHPLDVYDYRSRPSTGWAGDRLVPYRRTTGQNTSYGYVWLSRWDTVDDAREFHSAYVTMLRAHSTTRVDRATWRITDGPYADAFHVVRHGRDVLIVNAPTVDGLRSIRPGISNQSALTTSPTETATVSERTTATRTDADPTRSRSPAVDGGSTTPGQPGFGIIPGVIGPSLFVVWWLSVRRP